jgi:hypothetical protein
MQLCQFDLEHVILLSMQDPDLPASAGREVLLSWLAAVAAANEQRCMGGEYSALRYAGAGVLNNKQRKEYFCHVHYVLVVAVISFNFLSVLGSGASGLIFMCLLVNMLNNITKK